MEEKRSLGLIEVVAGTGSAALVPLYKLLFGGFTTDQLMLVASGAVATSFVYELLASGYEVWRGKVMSGAVNKFWSSLAALFCGSLISVQLYDGENMFAMGLGVVTLASILYRFPLGEFYKAMGINSKAIIEGKDLKKAEGLG